MVYNPNDKNFLPLLDTFDGFWINMKSFLLQLSFFLQKYISLNSCVKTNDKLLWETFKMVLSETFLERGVTILVIDHSVKHDI